MPQWLRNSNGESITMVDHRPHPRLYDPDIYRYHENLTDHRVAPYKFDQSARTDFPREDSVPLFLSDSDGEPDPNEYITPLRMDRRPSVSLRILAGVLATAAMAILFALFASDFTRQLIVNAKASSTTVVPAPSPSAAAPQNSAQTTARDTQLKDPTRLSAPANQTTGVRSVTTVAIAPTRAEITTAYQGALQNRAPAAAAPAATRPVAVAAAAPVAALPDAASPVARPVAALPDAALPVARPVAASPVAPRPVAAPPPAPAAEDMIPRDAIHRLDPNEIASSLTRANTLIASGDLAAARLVLRRAADSGDARAAMTLAETYDPAVLAKLSVHGVVPDLAMARGWYEKAKQFGAIEATQRLEQLASKEH
jgi:hypothetical protein